MPDWAAVTEPTWSRWPVIFAIAAGMLLTGVTLGFGLASGIDWQMFVQSYTLTNLVIGLAFLASGAPVAWLTRNVVGPLLIAAGLCHLISAAATMMAVFGLNADWPTFVSASCRPSPTGRGSSALVCCFRSRCCCSPTGACQAESGRGWRG
jgi:two-component system, NarL family, sensor kinase